MNTANRVYPLSIAAGIQPGEIYVDDKAVLFWHYCGFGYITGKPSEAFLSDILSETLHERSNRRRPVWAHASSNIGSRKTALSCGFVEERRNTVIKRL